MKWIGILSMICFTISFVPQILRLWQTKQARDISLGLCFLLWSGYALGVPYILTLHDPVLIGGYSSGLLLSSITTGLTLYYRSKGGA